MKRILHYAGCECSNKKGSILDTKKKRKLHLVVSNPADVTCGQCIDRMSKYAREERLSIINKRTAKRGHIK